MLEDIRYVLDERNRGKIERCALVGDFDAEGGSASGFIYAQKVLLLVPKFLC